MPLQHSLMCKCCILLSKAATNSNKLNAESNISPTNRFSIHVVDELINVLVVDKSILVLEVPSHHHHYVIRSVRLSLNTTRQTNQQWKIMKNAKSINSQHQQTN